MPKPELLFQATIDGTKYKIDLEEVDGLCNDGDCDPVIRLPKGFKRDRKSLEILVHEILHASNWGKTEKVVTRTAKDIARVLWRLYCPR